MNLEMSKKNRRATDPFSSYHKIKRLMWRLTWLLLAYWTPPSFAKWRRFLLKIWGAQMGVRADVRGTANIWSPENLIMENDSLIAQGVICYNQATITICSGAIVSQSAYLCASGHNIDDPDFRLIAKPIKIGAKAWIATQAFVGPGVVIGEGAVLGARAVTFKNLETKKVYIGNPATPLRERKY